MRDNQEMANILCNSNLATADQINGHWAEITETSDIGQVLVNNGILLQKVYEDLLVYIDSLHPENQAEATIHPDPVIEEKIADDDKPFDATMVLEENPFDDPIVTFGDETKETPQDIPGEAFIVDLDDVEPHVDEDEVDAVITHDSILTDPSDILITEEPHHGEKVRSSVQEKLLQKTAPVEELSNELPPLQEELPGEVRKNPNILPKMSKEQRELTPLTIQIPETVTSQNSLNEILLFARNNSVSDLHLIPDAPITMRRYGSLHAMGTEQLSSSQIESMVQNTLPAEVMAEFRETGDIEFVHTIPGGGRFRVTIMKVRNGWTLSARIINLSIRSFEELGLSQSAYSLTRWAQGLVLVTGPTGCGKSTTLSTLIETINRDRNEHIITIEDPIETLFPLGKSQITQRQIGLHTLSQDNALRGALRQDPDILMVSELRDMDSIQLAVSAAETGHLVFGTMNTTNAIRTINRLIESFPADEQGVIRNMVSESLRGVIAQQLIPRKDGNGVVPAFEVLLVTPAVSNMIRKDEMHQLGSAMVTGRNQGMVLFDDSLMSLVEQDLITGEEAYNRANDKEPFKQFLTKGAN